MATVIVHNECSPWKSYAVNTRLETRLDADTRIWSMDAHWASDSQCERV